MTGGRREALRGRLEPILAALTADHSTGSLGLSARLLASRLGAAPRETTAVRGQLLAAELPEGLRLQALDTLVAFEDPGLSEAVGIVLASGSPGFLARVLAGLGRSDDPKLAEVVLGAYPGLDPAIQPLTIDLLLQREPWARRLLDRVLDGKLPRNTLNANHLRKILESNDREAIWAVEKAWGMIRPGRNPEREKVVAEMGDYFRRHPGDPQAGRAVFRKLCAQCHTIYGEGEALGPDLTSNGRGSFDQLLASVFDPSLVIGESYRTTTVVTEDGRSLTGLVTEDSDRRVELALPGGGKEVIARNNVKSARTSALSMMPEGIETLLDRRELADLFAFLALDHAPGDPQARPIPGTPERKPVAAGP
jgi:putative heme-binding domain-containing protein